MSLPSNLYARLALALVFAALVLVVLAVSVEAFDGDPKPTLRAQPEEAHTVGAARSPGRRAPAFEFDLLLPRHTETLGFELAPLVGTLAVSPRASAFAPDVAPVVEVLADGSLALRRPKPLASGPTAAPRRSREGHGAGLVLPGEHLDELSAEARGALCGLLLRWFPDRPVPRHRLRPVGFRLSDEQLDRLLRWLP